MTKSKDRVSDLVNGHASCYCRNSLTHSSVALVKQSTNNIIRHNIFSQEVFSSSYRQAVIKHQRFASVGIPVQNGYQPTSNEPSLEIAHHLSTKNFTNNQK